MQFLWQHVSDMVGKGVDMVVLAKLFFYAGLSFTPLALPLSILLAALMTFGNLGEHFELLAMKASGISLFKIIKPLIITCLFIVAVSFYFQNNILPKAQVKMYTILLSLRQKTPELDIQEGSFCKEIPGYNIYVRHKDRKNGLLLDMMIYDYSKGSEKAIVLVADTGKLSASGDKKNLVLTLWSGASFRNFDLVKNRSIQENVPYLRETFSKRTILIQLDTNFNMADESIIGGRDVGKNMTELTQFIDSVKLEVDSTNRQSAPYFKNRIYKNTFKKTSYGNKQVNDTLFTGGFYAFFDSLSINKQMDYLNKAKSKAESINSEYLFTANNQSNTIKTIHSHQIQLQKKFTLSLACLLFFFIGAPLGAIIRKGGLGLPAVLSVFLFIFYYTVDTFGLKFAKQEIWPVWEGMWLSSAILASLGAFFTYKAVNDSVVMNPDAWKIFLQKLLGKKETRNYTRKEVIMMAPDYPEDRKKMEEWNAAAEKYRLKNTSLPSYTAFWKKGKEEEIEHLIRLMEAYIEDLQNSGQNLIIGKLMDYPVISPARPEILNNRRICRICAVFFPAGILLYLAGILRQKQVNSDLKITCKVNNDLIKEIIKL
jgi:lipopolysaccharide export system permease protein